LFYIALAVADYNTRMLGAVIAEHALNTSMNTDSRVNTDTEELMRQNSR